jgi:hypothetical protein
MLIINQLFVAYFSLVRYRFQFSLVIFFGLLCATCDNQAMKSVPDSAWILPAKPGNSDQSEPAWILNAAGMCALHEAAKKGDLRKVAALINQPGSEINSIDHYRKVPLHYACIAGHYEVAEYLLANGANVEAADVNGRTSLHFAANRGHSELVKLLIAKGGDHAAEDIRKLLDKVALN